MANKLKTRNLLPAKTDASGRPLGLGQVVAQFGHNPLHQGLAWMPASIAIAATAGAIVSFQSGETAWAVGTFVLGAVSGAGAALLVRRAWRDRPLVLYTEGFDYWDGIRRYRIRYRVITAFRPDYRAAHDPRPWARTYGLFVESAGESIHIGPDIKGAKKAIETMKRLVPPEVVQDIP